MELLDDLRCSISEVICSGQRGELQKMYQSDGIPDNVVVTQHGLLCKTCIRARLEGTCTVAPPLPLVPPPFTFSGLARRSLIPKSTSG